MVVFKWPGQSVLQDVEAPGWRFPRRWLWRYSVVWWSIVQDNTQEGTVDMETAIVLNEPQFPEFVHEEIDPRARCANHFS